MDLKLLRRTECHLRSWLLHLPCTALDHMPIHCSHYSNMWQSLPTHMLCDLPDYHPNFMPVRATLLTSRSAYLYTFVCFSLNKAEK